MTEFQPEPIDPIENAALLDRNAAASGARLREFSEKYNLLDASNELEDILKGIRDFERPQTAQDLDSALVFFLKEMR